MEEAPQSSEREAHLSQFQLNRLGTEEEGSAKQFSLMLYAEIENNCKLSSG